MNLQKTKKLLLAVGIAMFVQIMLSMGLTNTTIFASEKQITAAATLWPPYMGLRLKDKGFLPEILVEAFNQVNITVNVEFMPWEKALNDVKNGEKDILCGVYYTSEREEFLAYSQSIAEAQDALFMKKGRNITYRQLSDLKAYKIGVLTGAAHGKEFDAADFLNKEDVNEYGQNIRKLLIDKIDLMAGPRDVLNFIIKRDYPQFAEKIVVVHPPLSANRIYVGFSKKMAGYPATLREFSRGMELIKENGTFDRLAKKHGIDVF